MKLKKWLSILLTGVLAFSLTGCVGTLYEKAMTIEGTTITSGMYLMLQLTAYNEASGKVEDEEKDVLKQKIEGESATSWIKNRTEELCLRYVAVKNICAERDITLSSESQENLSNALAYWEYQEDYYERNGISYETVYKYYENLYLGEQLFTELYGEDGELAPDDADLKAEYTEKYGHLTYLSIPITTGENEEPENMDEILTVVDGIVERIQNGADFVEAADEDLATIYDMLERSFYGDSAADYVYDSYIAYSAETNSTYDQEQLDEVRDMAIGDVTTLNTDYSIQIVQKIEMFEDDEAFEGMRGTMLSAIYYEHFEEYLKEIYADYEVDKVFGATWYLSPKKIEGY